MSKLTQRALLGAIAATSIVTLAVVIQRSRQRPALNLPELTKSQPLWRLLLFGPTTDADDSTAQLVAGQFYKFSRQAADLGPIVRFNIFGTPMINVTDAALIRVILSDWQSFNKTDYVIDGIQKVAKALFTLEGKTWQKHRKAMTPAFDQRHLHLVVDTTVEKVKKLSQMWGDDNEVEVRDGVSRITMDVLGIIMYSYDFECTSKHDAPGMRAIAILFDKLAKSFQMPRIVWRFHPDRKAFEESRHVIYDSILDAFGAKMREGSDEKKDRPLDMIDILAQESSLDFGEMMDEMMGLYFAGFETAASTLSFALFHLLSRPEVLAKARTEVQTHIGMSDPTLTTINKCQYLDGVVKESLRFNPTVAATSRTNLHDFEYNNMVFPKGEIFQLDMCSLHMSERYFKDAERFWPERWATANEWLVPGSFIPFLDGPHRCIGERMAMLEVKTTLAMFIRNYDMQVLPGQNLDLYYGITAEFKEGLMVKLSRRES